MLPDVRPSSAVWAETDAAIFGRPIPIAGVAGDQQAAMFGQACFAPGEAKNTYGTGAFLLANVGDAPVASAHGLLSTVLWQLGDGGAGRLRARGLGVRRRGRRPVAARRPARGLVGRRGRGADARGRGHRRRLPRAGVRRASGAPYWDPRARGLLIGLTRGTGLPEIARATIESIAYQVARRRRGDGGRPRRRR